MDMVVKGRRFEVTPTVRDYAQEKVGRVTKLLDTLIMGIEVELFTERNPAIENNQVAEVTVRTKGHYIRAREAATDMFAAIDLVSEKLERQARKLKGKVVDRHNGHAHKGAFVPSAAEVGADAVPGPEGDIVKTKNVEVKAMSADEAILQMELLGHDFFVFAEEGSGDIGVLYRRRDGDYGLLRPARS